MSKTLTIIYTGKRRFTLGGRKCRHGFLHLLEKVIDVYCCFASSEVRCDCLLLSALVCFSKLLTQFSFFLPNFPVTQLSTSFSSSSLFLFGSLFFFIYIVIILSLVYFSLFYFPLLKHFLVSFISLA